MILLKPCPPCCPNAPQNWPSIFVHDDFWSYSKGKKLIALQHIAYNRTDLADSLSASISTLESGADLVQGG